MTARNKRFRQIGQVIHKAGKGRNRLWVAVLFCLTLSVFLQLAARNLPGFGEWYGTALYPVLVGTIGRFWGLFPFSASEIGIYRLAAGFLILFVCCILKRTSPFRPVCLTASLLFLLYTVNCGVNYYRTPFSAHMGLEIKQSTAEELENLCIFLTDQVNRLSEDGVDAAMSLSQAGEEGVKAMEAMGEDFWPLNGYYPRPKPVLCSWILSVQQLCGIYSPFTIEANYNRFMPDYNIPHTICHELSHLRGFMREDEANFIGYLACIRSESPQFQYSGYLTGWVYATNALYRTDAQAYSRVRARLNEKAQEDLRENNAFWGQYEGKVAEAANQLNDAYLKINSQDQGVASYGQAVDLMLAYAREYQGVNSR